MMLLLLFAAHALCDYPLQRQFLSDCKNHKASLTGVPWYQCLLAHSLIHAGAVALITHNVWLGVAEFFFHAITDYEKSEGWLTFNQDQAIHYGCKVVWFLIAMKGTL